MPSSAERVRHAIAERTRHGGAGDAKTRVLAAGSGWRIVDSVCSADAADRAFEERHEYFSLALVAAGAFDYHGMHGRAHLQSGTVLLGNAGATYSCAHTHGAGDRCIAFQFAPDAFEALWAAHGPKVGRPAFGRSLLPNERSSTKLLAAAEALAEAHPHIPAEDLATTAASFVLSRLEGRTAPTSRLRLRRVAELARAIEIEPDADWSVERLAHMAGMNVFVFIRCFKHANGLTPYAFVRHVRLREAARLLRTSDIAVVRVAAEAGFGDLSTFNGAFKFTFGATPTAYRSSVRRAEALVEP